MLSQIEIWRTILADFHFLRPWWFITLPLVLAIFWWARRSVKQSSWQDLIHPELLQAMLQQPKKQRALTPTRLFTASLIVWLLALAGPSCSRQPSDLVDTQAALVIALYLGESMLSQDLKPNRLAHAKLKAGELLSQRQGAATGLMVYSGSAHRVLPLTKDTAALRLYLQNLSTQVMPTTGNRVDLALTMAEQMIPVTEQGSVILITDSLSGITETQMQKPASALGLSTQLLHITTVAESSVAAGLNQKLSIVPMSADNGDIAQLLANIKIAYQNYLANSEYVQWRDDGYYLLWPLLLLLLLWYRQGMVLQW